MREILVFFLVGSLMGRYFGANGNLEGMLSLFFSQW